MRRRDDMQPPRGNFRNEPRYGRDVSTPRGPYPRDDYYDEYPDGGRGVYSREPRSRSGRPSAHNYYGNRGYQPREMFERDPRHSPYGSGMGRSNYGASKYGGSDYANVDYDRTPAERSNYGGPYTMQSDSDDIAGDWYGRSRDPDRWTPADENENSVDYDPGSWVDSPRARHSKRPIGHGLSDERIRQWVYERLSDAPALDDRDIHVQVHDHEVTLTGYVTSRGAKHLAEELVESVGGVAEIDNRLQISGTEFTGRRDK